jgi:preprotein translocase subunit SecG
MENVLTVIHLLLTLSLIAIVLLQRSEGGGLGIGGGSGGMMSARGAATALGRVTWFLAAGFIATSIALTILAVEKSAGSSVLDRLGDQPAATEAPIVSDTPAADLGADLLPPTAEESGPIVPSAGN